MRSATPAFGFRTRSLLRIAQPTASSCPWAPRVARRTACASADQPHQRHNPPTQHNQPLDQPSQQPNQQQQPVGGAEEQQQHDSRVTEINPDVAMELELEELDSFQEQMLKWLALPEDEQAEDLDEMVAYDEFGDEEYDEELLQEVDQLIEEADMQLKLGDTVIGTVYDVDEDGAYVEIGAKRGGFVPLSECSFAKLRTPLEVLRVGMTRAFVVAEEVDQYDQIILSLAAAEASLMWRRLRQLQEEGVVVSVRVVSANRGGLLVQYGTFEGFVPVSQFGQDIRADNMEALVGGELPVLLLEVNEDLGRLVFSNKRVPRLSAMRTLQTGDVCEGVVTTLRPFGAFLDLGGGTTGLLHVSQISHERVTNIGQVLQEGDRIKVMVLSADVQCGRVTLSTRKLEPMPGDMLRNRTKVYEQAEQIAAVFKQRVSVAQAIARGEVQPGQAGEGGLLVGPAPGDF